MKVSTTHHVYEHNFRLYVLQGATLKKLSSGLMIPDPSKPYALRRVRHNFGDFHEAIDYFNHASKHLDNLVLVQYTGPFKTKIIKHS